MRHYMTKASALEYFRKLIREDAPHLQGDTIAKREEWNNLVDFLIKEGVVNPKRAQNWSNPF